MHIQITKAFTTIYLGVSANTESIVDDIFLNIKYLNENIAKKIPISIALEQVVQLHLHCYK